jgi:diguanylate cyclase (GGDEF)-like protein
MTTTSLLANRVAETTAHRDRDELDLEIARLLQHFLSAYSVELFRLLDDGSIIRVVRRAAATDTDNGMGPEDVSTYSDLPRLADLPQWRECVTKNEIVRTTAADGRTARTLFPIRSDRDVSGVLVVDTASPLAIRDAEFVHGILRILQNHLALLEYGERDTLTSLLNRKTFEARFHKLHQRAPGERRSDTASQEPSWLALIDIDRFKSINDTYGHLFGDEVLLLTSQLMKRNFRGADQLFRFGGEEFVVVLEHASESGAQIALERLRSAVEAYDFPQVGRVTISVGYTQITSGDVATTCVERADAALYYVKNHGRNNLQSYEALIAAGEISAKKDDSEIELF